MKEFKEQMLELNLSLKQKQQFLFMACKDESPQTLQDFLDTYDEKIDITFGDGGLFKFAMAWGHLEILKTLISYYEKTQLKDLDKESIEYKYAVHKLETIIDDMIEEQTLSDEVLEVVKNYIPHEEVSDTEDNLEDLLPYDAEQHDYADITGSIR